MAEELIGGDQLYDPALREVQQLIRARSEEAVRRAEEEARPARAELRIVIADDQDLVRSGYRLILSSYENLRVVGEARNGVEAHQVVAAEHPDVVRQMVEIALSQHVESPHFKVTMPRLE
jgi:PleD family two-component response regulator